MDETLGSCGCTDYHVADCPTRTAGLGYDDYADVRFAYEDLGNDDYPW